MESLMRHIIYFVACLFGLLTVIEVTGQTSLPLTELAAELCEQHRLIEASREADKAIVDPIEMKEAQTWYIAGFIYKELYKERESEMRESPYRERAMKYLQNALRWINQVHSPKTQKLQFDTLPLAISTMPSKDRKK
jgi:hypothetical protein